MTMTNGSEDGVCFIVPKTVTDHYEMTALSDPKTVTNQSQSTRTLLVPNTVANQSESAPVSPEHSSESI